MPATSRQPDKQSSGRLGKTMQVLNLQEGKASGYQTGQKVIQARAKVVYGPGSKLPRAKRAK